MAHTLWSITHYFDSQNIRYEADEKNCLVRATISEDFMMILSHSIENELIIIEAHHNLRNSFNATQLLKMSALVMNTSLQVCLFEQDDTFVLKAVLPVENIDQIRSVWAELYKTMLRILTL